MSNEQLVTIEDDAMIAATWDLVDQEAAVLAALDLHAVVARPPRSVRRLLGLH